MNQDDAILDIMKSEPLRAWGTPEIMERLFTDLRPWDVSAKRKYTHKRLTQLEKYGAVRRSRLDRTTYWMLVS